jgi:hypothetical protein
VEDEGARSAPPRHNLVELEDAEEDDVLETKKNKKRSDGANMTKDKIKKQGEAATLSLKIDVMVKSKELLVMKTLDAKKEMMEKKNKKNEAKWNMFREDAKRKADVEESTCQGEPGHGGAHCVGECNYDDEPAEMDEFRLEWCQHAKMEILTPRRTRPWRSSLRWRMQL